MPNRRRDHKIAFFPDAIGKSQRSRGAKRKRAEFFVSQRAASALKTKIVVDYFRAWANIMKYRTWLDRVGYFDFFCGPGLYGDRTESTPVQIMRIVLADVRLRKIMVMLFEDKDGTFVEALEETLRSLAGFDQLTHAPRFSKGQSTRRSIEEFFSIKSVIPTFLFLDPFGYVGLTRELIRAILKDWGCEVLFYLNFNRIVGALSHPNLKIRSHMEALFGQEVANQLHHALIASHSEVERERVVLSGVKRALKEVGAEYVLPFGFRADDGVLDHHLVFATKNLDPAQKIMKAIMASSSSMIDRDGVAGFEFDPRIAPGQSALISGPRQLDRLKNELRSTFRGQTLRVIEVYELFEKRNETTFTIKNYQDALRELCYDEGIVKVSKGRFVLGESNIRRRHMHEDYQVTFPT